MASSDGRRHLACRFLTNPRLFLERIEDASHRGAQGVGVVERVEPATLRHERGVQDEPARAHLQLTQLLEEEARVFARRDRRCSNEKVPSVGTKQQVSGPLVDPEETIADTRELGEKRGNVSDRRTDHTC